MVCPLESRYEIRVSGWFVWDDDITELGNNDTLFEVVHAVLHEIIHILCPDYDEEEVIQKTEELWEGNLWLEEVKKRRRSREDLIKDGYKLKACKK